MKYLKNAYFFESTMLLKRTVYILFVYTNSTPLFMLSVRNSATIEKCCQHYLLDVYLAVAKIRLCFTVVSDCLCSRAACWDYFDELHIKETLVIYFLVNTYLLIQ